jgi:S1-C subfamily serine protease
VSILVLVLWVAAPITLRPQATLHLPADSWTARVIADLPNAPLDLDDVVARGVVPPQIADLFAGTPAEPPTELPAMTPDAQPALRAATVQVFAQACGKDWAGSGFVARSGVVVTNAHVVTGAAAVEVVTSDGVTTRAAVTRYDPARDLALLAVPGLEIAPLPLATVPAVVGDIVVSAGHPLGDEDVHVAPARVDAYGCVEVDLPPGGPASRLVYRLASADIAPGSSGGPIVNGRGEVIAVDFAVDFAGNDDGHAAAFAVSEIRADLADPGTAAVPTGAC